MSTARVTVQFRDGDNEQVIGSQLTLGPVSTTKILVSRTKSQIIPATTRRLRVQLHGDQVTPTCEAFFDLVKVTISRA